MIPVEFSSGTAMSADQIIKLGAPRLLNADGFRAFTRGLKVSLDDVETNAFPNLNEFGTYGEMFALLLQNMLPNFYDASYLRDQGGRISFNVIGISPFSILEVNRRVLTFRSAPEDEQTGKGLYDFEIDPGAFLAFFRHTIMVAAGVSVEEEHIVAPIPEENMRDLAARNAATTKSNLSVEELMSRGYFRR